MPIVDIAAILPPSSWDWAAAVVRDPYARLESEYFYRTEAQHLQFGVRPEFSIWVLQHLELAQTNRVHLDNHLRPQVEFIDEEVQLFRYERGLDTVAKRFREFLGAPTDLRLPQLNVGSRTGVKWSTAARIACNRFYKDDFDLLGYESIHPRLST